MLLINNDLLRLASGGAAGSAHPSIGYTTLLSAQDHIRTEIRPVYSLQGYVMKFSSRIKPISYLKSHAAQIVSEITESRQPLLITQNGEAKLVVMDVHGYEEQEQTMALLKILAMGSKEIQQGKFRDAEDVFADLDRSE